MHYQIGNKTGALTGLVHVLYGCMNEEIVKKQSDFCLGVYIGLKYCMVLRCTSSCGALTSI